MSVLRLTLLVLAGLLGLCGVAYGVSGALARSADGEMRVDGDVRRVIVRTDAGDVLVRSDLGATRVVVRRRARWLLGEPELRRTLRAGTLEIVASCPALAALGPCATDLDVSVPAGVDVAAASDGGDVRAAEVGGRLELRARGDVVADAVRPMVARATSRGGRIDLGFRNAPLQIEAVADGDVVIRVPAGDDYRVEDAGDGEVTVAGVFRSDLAARRIHLDAAGHTRILGR